LGTRILDYPGPRSLRLDRCAAGVRRSGVVR